MSKPVTIYDTTLRDGEQAPGATLNKNEKLEIARQLARLGVDTIEAGFPIASPDDFDAVKTIAQEVEGPRIAGLARAIEKCRRLREWTTERSGGGVRAMAPGAGEPDRQQRLPVALSSAEGQPWGDEPAHQALQSLLGQRLRFTSQPNDPSRRTASIISSQV